MPVQLTPAHQELLLLHILITTSNSTHSPDNDQFASGSDILNQIVTDFNAAGMPFGKRLTWAGLTLPVATATADRAWALASSFDDVSSKVFQPTAMAGAWGGPRHPGIGDVMSFLGMIP